jgi:hypothetical protein
MGNDEIQFRCNISVNVASYMIRESGRAASVQVLTLAGSFQVIAFAFGPSFSTLHRKIIRS